MGGVGVRRERPAVLSLQASPVFPTVSDWTNAADRKHSKSQSRSFRAGVLVVCPDSAGGGGVVGGGGRLVPVILSER